ncbi:SDR family NAD(P)-dependent oxidoreductase [Vibrio mediterranei]|uniref:SDR family NAD(P)-dependent oxidoreductase n=1 Tax=Vibrio barjaei TaxID=1676683 RepID=UPI0007BC0B37|nr:SDR family NAD(P)-dependent oxidoreductase [Vibrio barjaei]OIN26996.1 short chain dehydrogenase [Vibrio barjaei]
MNVLIVGASGGIGSALSQHILTHTNANVFATYRSAQLRVQHARLRWYALDVTAENDYGSLTMSLNVEVDHLDWVINCVGALSINEQTPEKNLKAVTSNNLMTSIQVNTMPTLLLAKHVLPFLRRSDAPRFATISARVGSIDDNELGGWYSYRCSKAALNMALKNISIEWGRLMKRSCTIALHPGTTDTELSLPFQANVPEKQLFAPEKTAGLLFHVLENLRPEDNGRFIAYDGSDIGW